MSRHAFLMQLKPGHEAEYKRRHEGIWPELANELKAAGISDYSIFLDPRTLTLFAVQTRTENNHVAELPNHPVMRRWWDYMADLMEVNSDKSPVCVPLEEVFYLD